MKALNILITRTITRPLNRAIMARDVYVAQELHRLNYNVKTSVEANAKLSSKLEALEDTMSKQADELEELSNRLMDTQNEQAIRESGTLSINEDSGDYDRWVQGTRTDQLEEQVITVEARLEEYVIDADNTDLNADVAHHDDILEHIVESFQSIGRHRVS